MAYVVEQSQTRQRSMVRLVLQWLVPVAILAVFVLTGHLGQAFSALSDIRLLWALPLVITGVLLPVSHAWRWCYLLDRLGESLPLVDSARITALASLLNYAAPGFLGAPAKAVFARESNRVSIGRSLPTLAAEQILDAAMLALFAVLSVLLVGPAVLGNLPGLPSTQQLFWSGIVLIVIAIVVFVIWKLTRRYLPGFVLALTSATRTLVSSREHMTPIAALTLTRWVLDMLAVGIASIAVGLRLSLVEVLLIANLSLLIGLIAPVPGGLGVREAVMAGIAGVIGVSIPAILAFSVLHRAGLAIGLPIVLAGARVREWSSR
jgi:glycosyltransferase 2 family protein